MTELHDRLPVSLVASSATPPPYHATADASGRAARAPQPRQIGSQCLTLGEKGDTSATMLHRHGCASGNIRLQSVAEGALSQSNIRNQLQLRDRARIRLCVIRLHAQAFAAQQGSGLARVLTALLPAAPA